MQKLLKICLFLIIFSAIGILGYFVYRQESRIKNLESRAQINLSDIEALVDEKIAAIKFPVATSSTTTIIQKVASPAPTVKPQPKEFIVSLGSGTVTETGKWVDIYSAQATINTDNYPNIKSAYLEVVMHLPNAQGEMQVKLVETTMPYYYGEILKTQSGAGQLVTAPITLQKGNRNYHVQLYNQIGTGILDSARIRIVTE